MSNFIDLNLIDGEVLYHPNFFSEEESSHYFECLLKDTPWQQDKVKIYGKEYLQPRLTAFYSNNAKTYSYSNITMIPHIFSSEILQIKYEVEKLIGEEFTSCLLNLYRDGNDSNGWHSDNEKELGPDPIIASISFGAHRMFHLKHRNESNLRHKIILENGSLLLMRGKTQQYWLHQIPKTQKKIDKRINLTFRIIK